MSRTLHFFGTLVVAGFLLSLIPSSALAQPAFVKLSWASEDAATTMGISWVTAADGASMVEYGINAVSENQVTGQTSAAEFPGIGFVHEVELTNLLPDTTYKYRVGENGSWSAEYQFVTAPNDQCTPFSFAAVGDGRSQLEFGPSPSWQGILEEAAASNPHFIINSGDLVLTGSDIEQWNNWLVASDTVNPVIPHLPSIGNHDDGPGEGDGANYNRLFFLPRNPTTNTEDYYHFVYNNLLVIALSTATFKDFAAQASYVTTVAAQHPNKWKLVFFHHPIYTSESFGIGHEPNEQGQNPLLGPAFDQAGIDLVVMGHNHHYERFSPLRYDTSNPEQGLVVSNYGNGASDGRMYVISGGAGSFTNPLITAGSGATGTLSRAADHHFVKITIAGNVLHYSVVSTNTGNAGGGNGVIDSVMLARPGPDPCAAGMTDQDGDGFTADVDCNDNDELINPGAAEICGNQVDEDCDNQAPTCPPPIPDMDGDGSTADRDCDDQDARRFPEAIEICGNQIDEDCDDVDPECPDAGAAIDAGAAADADVTADAGTEPPADAGDGSSDDPSAPDEGCGCTASRGPAAAEPWLLLLIGIGAFLRRRRR